MPRRSRCTSAFWPGLDLGLPPGPVAALALKPTSQLRSSITELIINLHLWNGTVGKAHPLWRAAWGVDTSEASDSDRPEFGSCHFRLLARGPSASPLFSEPLFLHLQNGTAVWSSRRGSMRSHTSVLSAASGTRGYQPGPLSPLLALPMVVLPGHWAALSSTLQKSRGTP